MQKLYTSAESEKVKILIEAILIDIQNSLYNLINNNSHKNILKLHKHYQELKSLNITLINPLTGEVSIPTVLNGKVHEVNWALTKKKTQKYSY